MYLRLPKYKAASEFAKVYKKKNGTTGVSRQYINQLIAREKSITGSTGLDILYVDGFYFVKYSDVDEPEEEKKSKQ